MEGSNQTTHVRPPDEGPPPPGTHPSSDADTPAAGRSRLSQLGGTVDLDQLVARAEQQPYDASALTALSAFQRSAERFPPLTPDEQLQMVAQIRAAEQAIARLDTGQCTGRERRQLLQQAGERDRLVEHLCASCWRLAWLIVREQAEERFGRERSADTLPDLMAEANTALVQAVRDFDPSQTPKFATYAARVVRDHTRAVLGRDGYLRLAPSWSRIKRIAATRTPELAEELGRRPTTEELQEDLLDRCLEWAYDRLSADQQQLPQPQREQLAMAKLRKQGMLGAIRDIEEVLLVSQTMASLDQPVGDDGGSSLSSILPEENTGQTFDTTELSELRSTLLQALDALSEREREIVLLRYGFDGSDGWTYAAIAERFSVSSERIRQIERAALGKLSSPHGQFAAIAGFLENH